jgi:hypothetical protein
MIAFCSARIIAVIYCRSSEGLKFQVKALAGCKMHLAIVYIKSDPAGAINLPAVGRAVI